MKILLFFSLINLFGCSSYVDKWHNEIAAGEKSQAGRPPKNPFDQFRNVRRPGQDFDRGKLSSRLTKNLKPRIKRKYLPANMRKRLTASDLNDNESVGSLWAGVGNDSYLFSKDTEKQQGDIILINVFQKFKNEISLELKRAFPDPPKDPKNKEEEKKPAAKAAETDKSKPVDKISTVIIEEISKEHLLLRGRKALLFKRRKRLVEVQALVARKDITDDDTVDSSDILESSIHVLR